MENIKDAGRTAAQGEQSKAEPLKWRFTGVGGLKRYLTDKQYQAQTHGVKKFYVPICDKCGTEQAGSAEQVSEREASQLVEWLDVDNHRLRRAMKKMMARLAVLLDEDQFAEFECLVSAIGVDLQSENVSEPMDEWVDYAKRSGLLDENGVATDPHKTQTAWLAFTAAWNLRTALSAPERKPFAYFQWNSGWGTWEQVIDSAAGREGVVAAYRNPAPERKVTDAAMGDALLDALTSGLGIVRIDPAAIYQQGAGENSANPAQSRMDAGSEPLVNQQGEQTAPEGCVIVPKEPTQEMIALFRRKYGMTFDEKSFRLDWAALIYVAAHEAGGNNG